MSYLFTFKYCFPSLPSSSIIYLPSVLPYPFVFFVVHSFILFGQRSYLVTFMLRIGSPWKHNHLRDREVGVTWLFRRTLLIKHCRWGCFRAVSTLGSFAFGHTIQNQKEFSLMKYPCTHPISQSWSRTVHFKWWVQVGEHSVRNVQPYKHEDPGTLFRTHMEKLDMGAYTCNLSAGKAQKVGSL